MTLVKDVNNSACVKAPFDEAKSELEEEGYHIISLEEQVRLIMREGRDSDIFKNGNWVKEGFLNVPYRGKFLTKSSPIIVYPVDATNAHREGKEFYLTNEQVRIGLRGALKLPDKTFSIKKGRFGREEVTVFAFGNYAQAYGDFLKKEGINKIFVWIDSYGNKSFARQVWFIKPNVTQPGLNGHGRLLESNELRVRGLKNFCEL
jgi:hypothetical protein